MAAANVIPFARPRAIASMPATFSPPSPTGDVPKPSWGSAAKPTPSMNQWSAPSESSWGFPVPVKEPLPSPPRQAPQGTRAPTNRHVVSAGSAAPKLQPATQTQARTHVQVQPATQYPAQQAPEFLPASQPLFQPAQPPHVHPQHRPQPAVQPQLKAPPTIVQQPLVQQPFVQPPIAAPAAATVVMPMPDHVLPAPASRWAAFERLGLRAPSLDPKQWTKHVVSMYRLLGFAILTIIVIVLVGYLVTTAFFYMSNSWIVPMAITSTDEKVVALESQLAERQNARDRIAIELDQAERAIAVQQQFQLEFAKAIKSDLDGRKSALDRMHQLANVAASTRQQIRRSNNAYASASQRQMADEWKAGLIDRQQMLAGKFQVAQISSSNLSLAERQAEYETRAQDLEAQTRSLEALLANTSSGDPLSYDVLKIKQEYETSRLETQKAIETRDTLKAAVEREDRLLTSLKGTSYLRALNDHASVAFVPYGNLTKVEKGGSLYGCKLGMVVCHKVGTVLEILPGEVSFKHPHKDQMMRGQMVELKLEDQAAASDDVLFVGGRPLLI